MSLPYSTLEVRRVEDYDPYDYGNANGEIVPRYDTINPQVAPFEAEGAGGYFPEVVNHQKEEYPSSTTPPAKFCGLRRRKFYIILAVVLVVIIGAIAGGVSGGLTRKHLSTTEQPHNSQSGNPRPNSSNDTNVDGNPSQSSSANILSISKLSSSNMTGSDGNTYRTVFFQDSSNAIIARRWDSQNRTWETSNITRIMEAKAQSIDPIAGTPLASISCDEGGKNQVHVWFTTRNNFISTLMLRHAKTSPDGWGYDGDGTDILETFQGSQLAATWQRCWSDNCPNGWGNWAVAYQAPSGDINVANSSDWRNPTTTFRAEQVAQRSSLGLITRVHSNGDAWNLSRLTLISEVLHPDATGLMQQAGYVDGWTQNYDLIDALAAPQPNLQFAITLMKDFNQPVFLTLLPNGTVSAMWWTGHHFQSSSPSVEFKGGPSSPNFTAISGSEDSMFYGISDGQVLQYEVDVSDPFTFTYSSRVYP
ncbi:hypothetical protein F5Y11DRAFT_21010 [Daldinia sp. FL1419]|nr:hypothetical protein F5Y11DRAFT_21010 [Daldinia sp. FL1419]